MKTIKTIAFGVFAGLLALTIVTLSTPVSAEAATEIAGLTVIQMPADDIADLEALDLQYMVEEEKLARDVYITMYEQWGLSIFQNISESEQTHMDAIRTLLTAYGVDDPTISTVGKFTNPELQTLYNDLIDWGSQSLANALKVGGAIEEIDILDLEERIETTDKANIELVYENLLKGSENHLRAYVSTYERQTGEDYGPQYLEQDRFDEIMSGSQGGSRGRGGPGGGGRGNGGGRRD